MAIITRLDRVMADRKITGNELAKSIGLSAVNLSRIRTGHLKGIRFSTLDRLCRELHCQPGDLFEFMDDEEAQEKGFV